MIPLPLDFILFASLKYSIQALFYLLFDQVCRSTSYCQFLDIYQLYALEFFSHGLIFTNIMIQFLDYDSAYIYLSI